MPSYKYIVDFIANTRRFNSDVDKAGASVKRVMGGIAGAVGVGLSAAAVIDFTKELTMLGGEAQGVRAAFNRISDDRVLEQLKEATSGTVAELDLMKRAVSAKNLGLPVENLASLFEFATKRAQDTGESVDYLVNSIVTGIGRKSPLILDNLGISAIQLREKLKGVGMESASVADVAAAVGEIAAESMQESGDVIDTNAIKVQNLSAQWKDFKTNLAENENIIASIGDTLTKTQQLMFVWNSEYATTLEKWAISIELSDKRAEKYYNQVKAREDAARKSAESFAEATKYDDNDYRNKLAAEQDLIFSATKQITTYGDLKEQIKEKNALLEKADVTDRGYIKTLYAEIEALEKQKKAFEALADPVAKRVEAPEFMQGMRGGESLSVSLGKDELKAFDEQNSRLDDMAQRNQAVAESVNEMTNSWQSYIEKMWQVAESHEYLNGGLTQLQLAGMAFAETMMQTAYSADVNLKNLGATIKNVVADTIRAYIAEGVAGAVSKSLAFLPFPFNMAAGAAAAVGATALFNSIIPAFADGGIIKGPTVGLMGEYPGASRNPEVVGKLSDLEKMLPRGSSETQVFIPAVKLKDDHILISFNRAQSRQYKTT